MQKLGRIVLLSLGLIVGLAVLILIGINMYVQSRGTQARIQHELSRRLGTPLRIQRISVTPWAGLKLTGITIPQTDPGVSPDFLSAKTFRLRIQFASLFGQQLVIKEVALIGPEIFWAQNAEGKWRLPSMPAPPEPPDAVPPPPAPAVPGTVPAIESVPETPPGPPAIVETLPAPAVFTPEVQRVNVVRARFQFLDRKQQPVATFEDVNFRSSFRTANDLRGRVTIARTSLRNRFFLQQLHSPLRYDSNQLDFSEIVARAGEGEISGRFTMQPQAQDSPFTVQIQFRDVQADRIITEAGGALGTVTGKLEGHLEAAGNTADPNALTGKGEIVLRDGQVRQYALLVALGQLLQIQELQQLRLDQAQIKYHINPGVVTIDEMVFRSENIRLSATGTVGFDGKLHLESQLAVNEKMRGQLFRAVRDNFKPIDDPGYSALSFQVSGTVGRPKTNLMERLIGRDLKDLSSVITGLMGGGKDKKKKAEEPAAAAAEPGASSPAPTPSPSPSP
ncbi:MAG TPA: AsmA-like C-terminal region-containing protein [Chthoniobacterales bacterium]|nr:AsmA-like C-terminal region-containing protein [Chthoniobacterales bacterium]